MGEQGQQYPEGHSDHEASAGESQKITVFEGGIALCVTALVAIGGVLFGDHLNGPGTSLFLAAFTTGMYGLFVRWRRKVNKKHSIGAMALGIAALSNGLFIGWAVGTLDVVYSRVELFHAHLDHVLLGGDSGGATPLGATTQTPLGPVTKPIQLMTYITVENENQLPETITGISMASSQTGGASWQRLCPVRVADTSLTISLSPGKAGTFSTKNFVEKNLIGKRIEPKSPISSWSAWECPGACDASHLRLTITDAAGYRNVTFLTAGNGPLQQMEPGGPLVVGPPIDMSHDKLIFDPKCHRGS